MDDFDGSRQRPAGHVRAGAARVDITPHAGIAMAGYSAAGRKAAGARGRLYATALYLEDARGERAAFCVVDLMSASRCLLERAAERTAAEIGLDAGRLILHGTHTHTAPGHFYGNTLYDSLAQNRPGFDEALTDWLASGIAASVSGAARAARPARAAAAVQPLWGWSKNASLAAFQNNPDAARWHEPGWPGAGAPEGLEASRRAVDPRVTVLAVLAEGSEEWIGVFATFACHCTAEGSAAELYSADWAGAAARAARAALASGSEAAPPVVAVGAAACGDINALRPELSQGPQLARLQGGQVGAAIVDASRAAARRAGSFELEVRCAELCMPQPGAGPAEALAGGRPQTQLAEEWCFGAAALGGAEDARSWVHKLRLAPESRRGDRFPPGHPQHPKARALGPLQAPAARLLGLAPSPRLPIHLLRVAGHLWAALPGEPSVMAAHRIERSLRELSGGCDVTVLGCSGDYVGYATTAEEYDLQRYEGASTLFGRNTAAHWQARLEELLSAADAQPSLREAAPPDARRRIAAFAPPDPGQAAPVAAADIGVEHSAGRIVLRWTLPRSVRLLFADGWLVRLETLRGDWVPLLRGGRPFDDTEHEIEVRCSSTWLQRLRGRIGWMAVIETPGPDAGWPQCQPLRVRVASRPGFAGLAAPVPEQA